MARRKKKKSRRLHCPTHICTLTCTHQCTDSKTLSRTCSLRHCWGTGGGRTSQRLPLTLLALSCLLSFHYEPRTLTSVYPFQSCSFWSTPSTLSSPLMKRHLYTQASERYTRTHKGRKKTYAEQIRQAGAVCSGKKNKKSSTRKRQKGPEKQKMIRQKGTTRRSGWGRGKRQELRSGSQRYVSSFTLKGEAHTHKTMQNGGLQGTSARAAKSDDESDAVI